MKRTLTLALAAGVAGCASAQARPGSPPAAAQQRTAAAPPARAAGAPAQDTPARTGPFKPWAEVTRDATRREGWLDTYEKGDALFLAVPRDRLGKDFLISYQISQGVGAAGLFGGTMLNIFEGSVVAMERHGDRVFLVRRPIRFTAPQGSPTEQAVGLTFSSSVLASAKIESINADSTLLVNAYDWFVSDLSGVGERVRFVAAQPGQQNPPPVPIEKERSYLESVKAFPGNVNVRAQLTFRPSTPVGLNSLADGRTIPVGVAYTLAPLPEQVMTPRDADDRVGYFLTARKDFSTYEDNFFRRYVNRWRLEPGRQVEGGLWEPKQPIVYYLDHNIPVEYRPFIKAGVEAWSQGFEAAGWKNAIRAEMLPEGADAEDLRYHVIRWNVSDQPGYGAIGPSIVDPRSGEVLDADILIEASMINGYRREWRTMVTPAAAIEEALGMGAAAQAGVEHASFSAELASQGSLLRTMLLASGEIGPNDAVPMEYVGNALKWVTMHEVGHTLGLRHNFRASSDTPLDRLADRAWTEQNGVFSSVMDYPTVNLPERGKPAGYAYNPNLGSYDRWAIGYGYSADASRAARLAREAALPGHAFGTDEDSGGPGALDPTVNLYDLGQDPLAWARGRATLIQGILPNLPRYVMADNARYGDVTDAFNLLLNQYARSLAVGVKYIGGQYVNRDRMGDPSGRMPFVAVPPAKQREALAFLNEFGFGENAFVVPPSVLASMGSNRWSHWGNNNTYPDGRIDYPFTTVVLGAQRGLLNQLTAPSTFAKLRDAELKFGAANTLGTTELLGSLTRSVWAEAYAGRSVGGMRRELQRAYVDRLTDMVARRPEGLPGDARAAARATLVDLRAHIGTALAGGRVDAITRAHLTESRARIDRALEAGLDVELAK